MRQGLDPNNRIIMTTQTPHPPNVPVDMLNTIYNAVDIGVNTCKGEGWGLVSHEHAACRVAQVVPDHTSCKEIGVNTCKGEGWGLVSHEHAACRIAQVVPDHTSCKEIFEGYGKLIRCDHIDVDTNYAREMPCPSSDHLTEILNELYEDRSLLQATADACYERATDPQFDWDTVASQFGGIFEDVMNEVDHSVEEETPVAKKKKKKKK